MQANYEKVVKRALDLLVDEEVYDFPVDPFRIAKNYGWEVMTYSELTLINCCSFEDVISVFGEEGFTKKIGRRYVIVYNNKKSSEKIRFTIMHEIGHIFMGHFKYLKDGEDFGNLEPALYKMLENEANCFSRNVNCPCTVIKNLLDVTGNKPYLARFMIKNFFRLTDDAARVRIDFLGRDLYYIAMNNPDEYTNNCNGFIDERIDALTGVIEYF